MGAVVQNDYNLYEALGLVSKGVEMANNHMWTLLCCASLNFHTNLRLLQDTDTVLQAPIQAFST